jgi:AcrR family transcriptional regulator
MAKRKNIEVDISTEEKIKEAARKIFTQKGYAATRTRDIAEESGINLALLNYYFRSKEKLFQQIMSEKLHQLFGVLLPIINDESSDLRAKLELITANYIDLLTANPDLPLFVLSEIRTNGTVFLNHFPIKKLLRDSIFVKQIRQQQSNLSPLHFLMNLLGMIVFPFVGSPVFKGTGVVDDEAFEAMMTERKQLIPMWINLILKAQ